MRFPRAERMVFKGPPELRWAGGTDLGPRREGVIRKKMKEEMCDK